MTSEQYLAALKDARDGLGANLRSGNARDAEVMLDVIEKLEQRGVQVALAEQVSRDTHAELASQSLTCMCESLFRLKGMEKCPLHPNFEGLLPSPNRATQSDCERVKGQAEVANRLGEALGAVEGLGLQEMLNTVRLLREHWLEGQEAAKS